MLAPEHFAAGCTQLPVTLEKRWREPLAEPLDELPITYPDQFALVACWTAAEAADVQAGTAPSAQATVAADNGMSLLVFISNTVGAPSKKPPRDSEETATN